MKNGGWVLALLGFAIAALGASAWTGEVVLSESSEPDGLWNCPQPGKWAISVWTGSDGTATDQALATCEDVTVAVVYWLDPATQGWLRYLPGRPEVSNLLALHSMQTIITRGSEAMTPSVNNADGLSSAGAAALQGQSQGGLQNCPQPDKWAMSVWEGQDSFPAEEALVTCANVGVAGVYWLNPETQTWLRHFPGRPEVSSLATLDYLQGVIMIGSPDMAPPTPATTPTPAPPPANSPTPTPPPSPTPPPRPTPPPSPTPTPATLVVAASNAAAQSKLGADYVCDGTADEAQINAAIAALPAGGGKIVLTEGTFTVTTDIVLDEDNVILEGQGPATLVTISAGANAQVLKIVGNDVTVTDLAVDGNAANQSGFGWGIDWGGDGTTTGLRPKVQRVKVYDTKGDGILFDSSSSAKAIYAEISDCVLTDIGQHGINLMYMENVVVRNNFVSDYANESSPATGIRLQNSEEIRVEGNHVLGDGSLATGKFCYQANTSCGNITFINNISEDSDDDGMYLGGSHIKATGNTVINPQGPGIGLNLGTHFTVVGNSITMGGGNGILVDGAAGALSDITIMGNVLDGNADCNDGIRVDSSSGQIDRVLIEGNIVTGFTNTGKYGIYVNHLQGGTDVLITDNAVNGNTNAIGFDAVNAAGTEVRGNHLGYVTENNGKYTTNGDGSTATFNIPHGCATTPTYATVTPSHADCDSDCHISAMSSTNITVTFARAPPSGMNNVVLYWKAEV